MATVVGYAASTVASALTENCLYSSAASRQTFPDTLNLPDANTSQHGCYTEGSRTVTGSQG